MKKIIILIAFLSVSFIPETKAQVTDTLAYLKSIVTNKAQYIGQPFSVLYNNLQIQVKYFHPFAAMHSDKTKETSTSFSFYLPQDRLNDFHLTFPKLRMSWQIPLNIENSWAFYRSGKGAWVVSVYNLYKNIKIADIQVRE